MTVLFEDLNGDRYPASRVKKIGKARTITYTSGREGVAHYVTLDDGEVIEVNEGWIEELCRAPISTWAAASGTYVVSVDMDDNDVVKWPVVGWAASADTGIYPITLNGVNESFAKSCHILLPSGEVTAYDQLWPSLEHWKADNLAQRD